MKEKKQIISAIEQIALREERGDSENAINTFFDCNITPHLMNINHQIIQGRRGTGKTHILHVLTKKMESANCHCFYFDCKATGSAAEISDEELPQKHRAIQLICDFLLSLHKDFLAYYSEALIGVASNSDEISELLNQLYNECYTVGELNQSFEKTKNRRSKRSDTANGGIQFLLSSSPSVKMEQSTKIDQENEIGTVYSTAGVSYKKIVFPNVFQCLDRLAEISKTDFVILIDEWSNLPLNIQPHFAEFLRCCLFSCKHITVKIAVVKGRTNYCSKTDTSIYGFEIGADINVALDLDDVYMYDKNPRLVYASLYRILLTHLRAKGVVSEFDDDPDLLHALFGDDVNCSILLARASEGNPRDFLSILNGCVVSMGIIDESSVIDSASVYTAASNWYKLDKEGALSAKQKQFLSEIASYVIRKKETRGFVLKEAFLDHNGFKSLIDARVLHVFRTGIFIDRIASYPLSLVVLDFGIYSDSLLSGQVIHLLSGDTFEKAVFSDFSPTAYDGQLYQIDANRRVKLCVIDPEFSAEIFPSFSAF